MRSGIALRLHQRNDDSAVSAIRKELNSRIWWAHYSLERLVSNLTGRPSSTVGLLCSVPQPRSLVSEDSDEMTNDSQSGDQRRRSLISEGPAVRLQAGAVPQQNLDFYAATPEIASSGAYLRSILDLSNITQAVLELYSVSVVREPWDSVQSMIAYHNDGLEAWARALPGNLNFLLEGQVRSPAQTRSVEEPHFSASKQRELSQSFCLMLLWKIPSHCIRLGRGGKWSILSCRPLQYCVCRLRSMQRKTPATAKLSSLH